MKRCENKCPVMEGILHINEGIKQWPVLQLCEVNST